MKFITEDDFFNKGLAVYHVERRIEELNNASENHGEQFNAYVCRCLQDSFNALHSKLPIDVIPSCKSIDANWLQPWNAKS